MEPGTGARGLPAPGLRCLLAEARPGRPPRRRAREQLGVPAGDAYAEEQRRLFSSAAPIVRGLEITSDLVLFGFIRHTCL